MPTAVQQIYVSWYHNYGRFTEEELGGHKRGGGVWEHRKTLDDYMGAWFSPSTTTMAPEDNPLADGVQGFERADDQPES